jgi:hypothetical protein
VISDSDSAEEDSVSSFSHHGGSHSSPIVIADDSDSTDEYPTSEIELTDDIIRVLDTAY